jgi:hypothetical protein
MKRYTTRTFFKFLFGFLVIIVLAFVGLFLVSSNTPKPVDNVALPQ